MRKIYIFILILFLSACGHKTTANKIIDEIEEKNYFQAKKIYETASEDEDTYGDLKEIVSEELQNYIDTKYKEVEENDKNRASFYYLLTNIEEIEVHEYELEDTIGYYKDLLGEDTATVSFSTNEYEDVEEEVEEETGYEAQEEYDSSIVDEVSNPYTYTDVDHDCTDFPTHYDAQLFYEANGGPESDPHDLDRDIDELAGDWNP